VNNVNIERQGINWHFRTETVAESQFYKYYWEGINSDKTLDLSYYKCDSCDSILDEKYNIIINQLERANLLPDDFKRYCCLCYVLDKIGVLDLRKRFDCWYV